MFIIMDCKCCFTIIQKAQQQNPLKAHHAIKKMCSYYNKVESISSYDSHFVFLSFETIHRLRRPFLLVLRRIHCVEQ